MKGEMMGRKHLFPRPFRALPEETVRVDWVTQGLSLRSGTLG